MPKKYYTWETLPQPVKDMDPDEREQFLMEEGILLIPPGAAKPPDPIKTSAKSSLADTSGTDVMGFGPGLTHPENAKKMAAGGTAALSTLAGGASLPAALAVGAVNAYAGPDPFSGRGVAENAANIAFGRFAPYMNAGKLANLGPAMTAVKNGLFGAGQVGATQAAGNALTNSPLPPSPETMVLGGVASAVVPAAAGRFLQAVQKSTPMVRERMRPILEKLAPQVADAPIPPPAPKPPAQALAPAAVQAAATTVAPKEAARNLKAEKLANLMRQHNISADDAALMQGEHWEQLAQAAGVKPPSKDTVQVTMGMLRSSQPTVTKPLTGSNGTPSSPDVLAQSSQNDDLEEQLRQSLIARGKTPPPHASASIDPPTTAATAETALPTASPSPLAALDEMAQRNPKATAFQKLGGLPPSEYIAKTIDGNEWGSLPGVLRDMDDAFPDGAFRQAVKQHITEKVLSGVGTAGAFGDLTPLQRVQAFGKQKFGEKTGAQIINQIYDSPEAYRNLSDLQEIVEASGRGAEKPGWASHLKVIVNKFSPVLGGTAFGLTMYFPVLQNPAVAGAVAAGTAYKAFTLTADSLSDYLGKKNTKWADVLYDLATGGNRYSAQSVSNVISGLRRRAEEERDLSQEEALAEMAQYQ